ncbi:MAG: hypothetical protein HC941_27420 [Microcoleus sp. SU_5_3]|nr:hypothetical protein [Microcoleus sp. SU_5_3]
MSNGDFEGGDTRFFFRDDYSVLFDRDVVPDVSIIPATGMALCFRHELQHEGDRIISGRKYVLRSDVMYARKSRRNRDRK